ncbi:hypothetical protein IU433_12585 [Nocardia puris]|uniref:Uncharacterized protein n=1 Tax=Nocardia puris TaxID=208602 RepID=A0A366DNJ8_9NOCA|nr:hypothetical protein [Nocardia puris]MBF6213663.1 hypothetical protein [Nocardia puris]MBF6365407.1 hypothetical protein [Nocardia puris]MBF6459873.1 hypothetical protein [Nocardia puris]RBO91646.1 hypothetical protein DFR74_104350 [Nocardia puris]
MATYFDPKSWSPLWAVDLGKRLFDQSWVEQWLATTTSWVDPVVDLGSGTVTALMPDVLMTVLSEGILSRFGGREIAATLLGHQLTATLDVLKVRRRGAHFQTKTVLSGLLWDGHPIETVTVIAHGMRLIPGVPTKVRTASLDIEGTVTTAALLGWLNTQPLDWELSTHESGLIRAAHRKRGLTALVDATIENNLLTVRVHRATWFGIRLPKRMITDPAILLENLPQHARIAHAAREGDQVRFRVDLPETTGSFDLAQIRDAIVAGTTLIVF